MKKLLLMAALVSCGIVSMIAQEDSNEFTIATLNVDGLPKKLLMINLNADGPGDAGSARIGKYLANKGYDLVMMQEDFNFHGVLSVWLEDDYKMDEWSGDVGALDGRHQIDFLHLQNHRFECDGLMAAWKNDLQVALSARTPWTHNFGKFSHANDELITKGFRRYDVTMSDGLRMVVYNMHMDASMDDDEAEGKDVPDHDARMAQWAQLKDDVLQHLDSRPIIITGDLNSLYSHDEVKHDFIDAINDSGRGTASDVWVELQRGGVYPPEESTEAPADNEMLDKIIYINPTIGTGIEPIAISVDTKEYVYQDKPLGDHWPVAAKFRVKNPDKPSGIEELNREAGDSRYYNLNGQHINQPKTGIYIEQQGNKTEKRIIK